MAKRICVSVPHALGLKEARRRLNARVAWARERFAKDGVVVTVGEWSGNERAFTARALAQEVRGRITAGEDIVRFDLELPWMLAMFSGKIEGMIERYASRLLGAAKPAEAAPAS